MNINYKDKMSNKKTMDDVCKILEQCPEFEKRFSDSIAPVKFLLKRRFETMKIKDEYIECGTSASKEELDEFFKVIFKVIFCN